MLHHFSFFSLIFIKQTRINLLWLDNQSLSDHLHWSALISVERNSHHLVSCSFNHIYIFIQIYQINYSQKITNKLFIFYLFKKKCTIQQTSGRSIYLIGWSFMWSLDKCLIDHYWSSVGFGAVWTFDFFTYLWNFWVQTIKQSNIRNIRTKFHDDQ